MDKNKELLISSDDEKYLNDMLEKGIDELRSTK